MTGEHNSWHKYTNFELGTRVPLIIRAPMIPESIGHVVDGLAELIDVCDTIRFGFFLNLERTLMGWCAPPLLLRCPFAALRCPSPCRKIEASSQCFLS